MTHDLYRDLIQRELDGDLSTQEVEQLDAHVATCADCRREREDFQKLARGLASLPKVRPERDLVPEITLDILHSLQPPSQPRRLTRRVGVWGGLSAAAVAVLAISLAAPWNHDGGTLSNGQDRVALVDDGAKRTPNQDAQESPDKADGEDKTVAKPTEPSAEEDTSATGIEAEDGANAAPVVKADPLPAPKPTEQAVVAGKSETNTTASSPAGTTEPTGKQTEGTEQAGDDQQTNGTPTGDATPPTTPADPHGGDVVVATLDDKQAGHTDGTGDAGRVGLTPIGGTTGTIGTIDDSTHYGLTGPATTLAATVTIGDIEPLPAFDADLQQRVQSGDADVQWATDSFQVVTRNLELFGFSRMATVSATAQESEVRVVDNGTTYRVSLQQPFATGKAGIWVPTHIDRSLVGNPAPYEVPVVQYFLGLKANEEIQDFTALYALEELQGNQLLVSVDVTQKKNGKPTVSRWHVLFTLNQTQQGEWTIQSHAIHR
ncbi:MAG TPA: zf-HC2 domain-containing protein [Bacilli bacterium]|nr:zf-HC2 domain-containing protein [Bacilli bacterium]